MRAPPFWGLGAARGASGSPLPGASSPSRPRTAGATLRAYLFDCLRGALTSLDLTRLAAGERLEERARCLEVVHHARGGLLRRAALSVVPAERDRLLFAAECLRQAGAALEDE